MIPLFICVCVLYIPTGTMVWNSANCPNFCSFDPMVLEKEGISDTESQDAPNAGYLPESIMSMCVCVFGLKLFPPIPKCLHGVLQSSQSVTPPEVLQLAPEKWWLEDDPASFLGPGLFSKERNMLNFQGVLQVRGDWQKIWRLKRAPSWPGISGDGQSRGLQIFEKPIETLLK